MKKFYDDETKSYLVLKNDKYLELANIKSWHDAGYTGKGRKSAVLDTGVVMEHPLIKRALKEYVDFTGEGIEDLNGHGTSCALVCLATAPDIDLYVAKVADKNKQAFYTNLIRGVEWCIDKQVHIINISLGSKRVCTEDCKLKETLKKAKNANITISAAAGNEPTETLCPAKCEYVWSIGAMDPTFSKIAPYSAPAEFYGCGEMYYHCVKEEKE